MTIPRMDERRVEVGGLPTVRVPTDVPLDAVGGAIPRLELGNVARAFDNVWKREKEKADQIAVMGADAKAAALETHILHDPNEGLLNMRGKNALGSRDAFEEKWRVGMDDITKDLHNDTQRTAFQRSALNRYGNISDTLSRHISTEIEAYDDQETQSLVNNETNAATAAAIPGVNFASAADRSTMAIARQRAALMDFASRKGMSQEKRTELLAQVTSSTHTAVIDRMLSNEDDMLAKKYFEEFKDQIVGKDLATISKAIEVSSLRGESQRTADGIIAKYSSDEEAALKAVKEIKDPQLRDATETRVKSDFAAQQAIQRDKEEALYLQATNMIEPRVKSGVPFVASAVVPANVWSQLPIQARNALERRALHADSDFPNNPGKWHDFLDLTPAQMGSLNKLEFESRYWVNFDRETRSRSELMWASARDAARTGKLDAKQSSDLTFKDLLKRSIDTVNPVYAKKQAKDWTPDQLKFYDDFSIEAMRRKETAEVAKGKPLSGTEMQQLMDDLVHQRVFIDRTMHRDTYALPGTVSKDDRNRAYVPLESIPEKELNELRVLSPNASRRKIERLYAARLLNDPRLFREIQKEK